MTMEIVTPCCWEVSCSRDQPMRLQRTDDGRWWVLTQYREHAPGAPLTREDALQRHELTRLDTELLEAGLMALRGAQPPQRPLRHDTRSHDPETDTSRALSLAHLTEGHERPVPGCPRCP